MSLFSIADVFAVPEIELMDIGAALLDNEPHYAGLLNRGLGRVTAFEPDDEQRRIIGENIKSDRYRCLPYFLGDGKPATFHLTRYPGCSSLLEPDPAVIDLFTSISAMGEGGNFSVQKTIPVETTRLDDLDLPPIDYIKIDVQGSELAILQNGAKCLKSVLVIEAETEFVPIYKNQPLFGDIQCYLREQGFVLHKITEVAGRCFRPMQVNNNPMQPMSQLLWADSIFVRDFSAPESYSDAQLLKAAALLHECYRSFDLAIYLLQQHDTRTGSDHAKRYIEKLGSLPSVPVDFMRFRYH